MRVIIFDDLKSVFHFILRVITPFLGKLGLLLFLFYMVYQVIEDEDPGRKVGDFVEYLTGVGGCYIVLNVASLF